MGKGLMALMAGLGAGSCLIAGFALKHATGEDGHFRRISEHLGRLPNLLREERASNFLAVRGGDRTVGIELAEQSRAKRAPMLGVQLGVRDRASDLQGEGTKAAPPSKVIRIAKVSLEVKDLGVFEAQVAGLAERYGYVASMKIQNDAQGHRRATLVLRVESSAFVPALAAFKALGDVRESEVGVEDVTKAFMDLKVRIKNRQVAAQRMRELIQNRTAGLEEVIAAENALSEVTEELERLQAHAKGMQNQIAFSTIEATVFEPLAAPKKAAFGGPGLLAPLGHSFRSGVHIFIGSIGLMIEGVFALLPWAIVLGSIGWIASRFIRTKKAEGSSTV